MFVQTHFSVRKMFSINHELHWGWAQNWVLVYVVLYYCRILTKIKMSWLISVKLHSVQCYNSWSVSRVVPCRFTNGRADMSKQTSALSCKFSFQVRHETPLKTACGKLSIMIQVRLFFEMLLQNIPVIFNALYMRYFVGWYQEQISQFRERRLTCLYI